jgi:phosphoribosylglycinamide formyltransferase-1
VSEQGNGRLAVLISGEGSNLQAFIDACAGRRLDAHIGVVLSNCPGAAGLERAAAAGIPTAVVDHRAYATREAFDAALHRTMDEYAADLIILAGFMRILTPVFVEPRVGRLLNIHPSLLPRHRGLNTHQRALDAGDVEAGATVHFVTPELDGGPPIIQARVAVLPDDTARTLARRVQRLEHQIYPLAAQWYIEGRLRLVDGGARLDDTLIPPTGIPYEAAA